MPILCLNKEYFKECCNKERNANELYVLRQKCKVEKFRAELLSSNKMQQGHWRWNREYTLIDRPQYSYKLCDQKWAEIREWKWLVALVPWYHMSTSCCFLHIEVMGRPSFWKKTTVWQVKFRPNECKATKNWIWQYAYKHGLWLHFTMYGGSLDYCWGTETQIWFWNLGDP